MAEIKKHIFLSILSFVLIFSLCSCSSSAKKVSKTTKTLYDTVTTIELYDGDKTLLKDTENLAESYQKMFDGNDVNSEIYKLNNAAGKKTTLSEDTLNLLSFATFSSELSDGAFDITVKPVMDLWNFSADNPKIPSDSEIKEKLQSVGNSNIVINGTSAVLDNGAQVDVGGIAKGYIADRLVEYLRSRGCKNALINLGGNIYAMGKNKKGNDFTVGIQKPFAKTGEYSAKIIGLSDMSVVTSGNYIRYFKKDGKIYHHIIDPKTGCPADNNLNSVTVISKYSAAADVLSTACFVLGKEKGIELVNNTQDAEAVFITKDGKITVTDGLKMNDKKIPEIETKK